MGLERVMFELRMIAAWDLKYREFLCFRLLHYLSQVPDGTSLNFSTLCRDWDTHFLHYLWSTVGFFYFKMSSQQADKSLKTQLAILLLLQTPSSECQWA